MSATIKAIAAIGIWFSGKFYPAGTEFELDEVDAKDLIEAGYANEFADQDLKEVVDSVDDGEGSEGKDAEFSHKALVELLKGWQESDPEKKDKALWIKSGAPRNKTVDEALGVNVTNDQIKAALADIESGE